MMKQAEIYGILGLGASGKATASLLLKEGHSVIALDEKVLSEHFQRLDRHSPGSCQNFQWLEKMLKKLPTIGKNKRTGPQDPSELLEQGMELVSDASPFFERPLKECIISPGIPYDHPWANEARAKNIPLTPAFEFAWRRFKGKTIAITGSNGKSTVAKWCAESLQAHGVSALPCANYGVPVAQVLQENSIPEVLVMELSSFQLEAARHVSPDYALLLNVLPNHLDRHGSMSTYQDLKMSIFSSMREHSVGVIPFALREQAHRVNSAIQWVTFGTELNADYQYLHGKILAHGNEVADVSGTPYHSEIMGPSAAGSFALLNHVGVASDTALCALQQMEALPHRQEKIASIKGITFINDSKATNLAALQAAIKSTKPPIHLIAGGKAKEKDFISVKRSLADGVKSVYLIGTDAVAMKAAWEEVVPCILAETLEQAVAQAWQKAEEEDTVLLSPGCTSFDQFENYIERGNQFKKIVKELSRESAHEK